MRKLAKFNLCLFSLMLITVFLTSLPGCDFFGDDKENNASIVNVWKGNRTYDPQTNTWIQLPATIAADKDGDAVFETRIDLNVYIDFRSNNSCGYYAEISNCNDPYGIIGNTLGIRGNGVYYCPSHDYTYSVSANTITLSSGMVSASITYTVNGNTLSLTYPNGGIDEYVVGSSDDLRNPINNCQLVKNGKMDAVMPIEKLLLE